MTCSGADIVSRRLTQACAQLVDFALELDHAHFASHDQSVESAHVYRLGAIDIRDLRALFAVARCVDDHVQ